MNKKKLLGFAIPILLLVGIGGAVLLDHYGLITQNVDVEQAVVLECPTEDCSEVIEDVVYSGDSLFSEIYTLINRAETSRDVELVTGYIPEIEEGEITTSYYLMGTLTLTKKDTITWDPIPGEEIEITYTVVGDTFEATGIPEGYTLIYYKDEVVGLEGRLANPQPAIIVTSDIGNLPHSNDANIDELADYCGEPDNYVHCKGAKLWVVPTSDIIGSNLNWANMANYYYETDLITFTKETWKTNGQEITLQGEGSLSFVVVNEFNTDGFSGTITTEVNPV